MVKKASIATCLIVVAVALAALFYFANAKFENKMSKFWLLSAIVCMALAGGSVILAAFAPATSDKIRWLVVALFMLQLNFTICSIATINIFAEVLHKPRTVVWYPIIALLLGGYLGSLIVAVPAARSEKIKWRWLVVALFMLQMNFTIYSIVTINIFAEVLHKPKTVSLN